MSDCTTYYDSKEVDRVKDALLINLLFCYSNFYSFQITEWKYTYGFIVIMTTG